MHRIDSCYVGIPRNHLQRNLFLRNGISLDKEIELFRRGYTDSVNTNFP